VSINSGYITLGLHAPSSSHPSKLTHTTQLTTSDRASKKASKRSNGVLVPLQRQQRLQQGEEAAAQEGPAQAADRQDLARQPRGAGRQEPGSRLREISSASIRSRVTR